MVYLHSTGMTVLVCSARISAWSSLVKIIILLTKHHQKYEEINGAILHCTDEGMAFACEVTKLNYPNMDPWSTKKAQLEISRNRRNTFTDFSISSDFRTWRCCDIQLIIRFAIELLLLLLMSGLFYRICRGGTYSSQLALAIANGNTTLL